MGIDHSSTAEQHLPPPLATESNGEKSMIKTPSFTFNRRQTTKAMLFVAVMIANIAGSIPASAYDDGFYVDTTKSGFHSVQIGTDFTDFGWFLLLPPGSYIANASAVLANTSRDGVSHPVDCRFTVGGIIKGEIARGMLSSTNEFISLPLTWLKYQGNSKARNSMQSRHVKCGCFAGQPYHGHPR